MRGKRVFLLVMILLIIFAAGVGPDNNFNLLHRGINCVESLLSGVNSLKVVLLQEINQFISTVKITSAILLGIMDQKLNLLILGPVI